MTPYKIEHSINTYSLSAPVESFNLSVDSKCENKVISYGIVSYLLAQISQAQHRSYCIK